MQRLTVALVLAASPWGLFACKGNTDGGTPKCKAAADCASGEVCLSGDCRKLCNAQTACPAGQACGEGVCVIVGDIGPMTPIITKVDGNGTPNVSTVPITEGTPTDHRYRTSLRIQGAHLKNGEVALDDGSGTIIALTTESASESLIVATLPAAPTIIADGQYTLSVTNANGTGGAEVYVLQGEAGLTPDAQTISNVVLSLPEIHTGQVWGRFYEGEGLPQSVALTGEIFADATASGGFVRRAPYNGTAGVLYAFQSDALPGKGPGDAPEAVAMSNSYVTFRLKIADTAITNPLPDATVGWLKCSALLNAGSPDMEGLDTYEVKVSSFPSGPDSWEIFTLSCPYMPSNANQRISVEGFVPNVATLVLDYVRISPRELCTP